MELVRWPDSDLTRLRAAAEHFLNQRAQDAGFSVQDRADYQVILGYLRRYIDRNNIYWQSRSLSPQERLQSQ